MRKSFLVAGAAVALSAFLSVARAQDASAPAAPSPAQAAWERYRAELAREHDLLLRLEEARDPQVRAQGLYYLQALEATAHNMYIAPRQQYPSFYRDQVFSPLSEVGWGDPNPDFHYHWSWIDGANTYRVWGNKRDGYWGTIQVYKGFWGDEVQGDIGTIDLDDVPTDAEGNFEIFLGPNPPADKQGKFWVKLDPALASSALNVREVYYDWTRTRPLEIHIENLDRKPGTPTFFDEAELAARIDRARKFLAYNYNFTLNRFRAGSKDGIPGTPLPRNQITGSGKRSDGAQGANTLACYASALYDIAPDEALIMELTPPGGKYWGVQLENIWRQTTDYTYHQSSINGAQARVDADGKARIVLAHTDPGVPNWIDPVGTKLGAVLWRFYATDDCPIPVARKVRLADVRKSLPRDTPTVTAAERKASLALRTAAVRKRWHQ